MACRLLKTLLLRVVSWLMHLRMKVSLKFRPEARRRGSEESRIPELTELKCQRLIRMQIVVFQTSDRLPLGQLSQQIFLHLKSQLFSSIRLRLARVRTTN